MQIGFSKSVVIQRHFDLLYSQADSLGLYIHIMKQKHFDYQIVNSVSVINPMWPYIWCVLDGICSCEICEYFTHTIINLRIYNTLLGNIKKNVASNFHRMVHSFHKAHTYFTWVQCKLFVCGMEYCCVYFYRRCAVMYSHHFLEPTFFQSVWKVVHHRF